MGCASMNSDRSGGCLLLSDGFYACMSDVAGIVQWDEAL